MRVGDVVSLGSKAKDMALVIAIEQALARRYEELGGDVLYYGKPHRPIAGQRLFDNCQQFSGIAMNMF